MKTYLSAKPVWLEMTEEISKLDNRKINVVSNGKIVLAEVSVEVALEKEAEHGRCLVSLFHYPAEPANLHPSMSHPVAPTEPVCSWSEYLEAEALALVLHSNSGRLHGTLELLPPDGAECWSRPISD